MGFTEEQIKSLEKVMDRAAIEKLTDIITAEVERRICSKLVGNLQPANTEIQPSSPSEATLSEASVDVPKPPEAAIREPTWSERLATLVLVENNYAEATELLRARLMAEDSFDGFFDTLSELLTRERLPKFQTVDKWSKFFDACLDMSLVTDDYRLAVDWITQAPDSNWYSFEFVEMAAGFVGALVRHRGAYSMILKDCQNTLLSKLSRALGDSHYVLRSVILTLFPDSAVRRTVFQRCGKVKLALSELLSISKRVSEETLLLGYGLELGKLDKQERESLVLIDKDEYDQRSNLAQRIFSAKPEYVSGWTFWDESSWKQAVGGNNLIKAAGLLLDTTNSETGNQRRSVAMTATMLLIESGLAAMMPNLCKVVTSKLQEFEQNAPEVKHEITDLKRSWSVWNERKWAMRPSELQIAK